MPARIAFQRHGIHHAVHRSGAGRLRRRGLLAGVVLHRFDQIGKRAQRGKLFRRRRTGDALEHSAVIRFVGQTQPLQPGADEIQPGIHGCRIANFLQRPEALRDGRISWPDARVHIFRIYVFRPHTGFTAQNALLFFGREIRRVAAHRINRIVPRRGPSQIQIVAVRKNSPETLLGRQRERCLPAPGLNYDVLGHARHQHFVPADNNFSMLDHQLLDTAAEIGLQRVVVLDVVRFHVGLNLRVGVPFLAVDLVAADMKEVIGEDLRHFAYQVIEKFVDFLIRWIHRRIEDSPPALDFVGAFSAGQLRMSHEPRGAVPGHIKFRHDADAAIARIGNHVTNLILRVIQAVRSQLVEFRKFPALDAEALVFRKVPVEDVHFHDFHAVKVSLDDLEGDEMPRGIDH